MKKSYLLLVGTIAFAASPAISATIVFHEGKADPTTEGWNYATYGGAAGTNGPVGPGETEVASEDAWKVVDPGTGTRPTYESPRLTPSQSADLNAFGWELSVRVNAPEVNNTATFSRAFEFMTPGDPATAKVYRMYITTDANQAQAVTVYNLTSVQSAGVLSPGFHTYRFVATPDAGTLFNVSLFIDDALTPAVTDIPGFAKSVISSFVSPTQESSFFRVGSFGSGQAGTLYFSHASLNIVPEPTSIAIGMAAIVTLIGANVYRHKSRRRP